MIRRSTAAILATLTALALASCGNDRADSDPVSDDPPTGSQSVGPDVSDEVSLRLAQGGGSTTLSASNDGADESFVLLPVGEPERSESADGTTLTYVRPESEQVGEEPDLYEAVAVPAGSTRSLDPSTIGDWTVAVRVCLEVVPTDDLAASGDGGAVRVQGRESGTAPVVACSGYSTID
ncbi:MAG TPA: hypothetical protein VEX15_05040 [Nocardioidaceae bacterium]|nr:hypothetical protein [Nocardioidaceae bacterium]